MSPRKPRTQQNQNFPSKLTKFRLFLLYSFPVVLFFSYYPVIRLGASESMNFELSLPLIWLFFFSVLSLKDFFRSLRNFYKSSRVKLLFLLFPLYLSVSLLWSANPLRGVLTVGILWCLVVTTVVFFTTFLRSGSTSLLKKKSFERVFLYGAAAVCLFCWLQSFLDASGVSREATLLCPGCVSGTFGFPHPSGFAIEPQFMGNLLLAPIFYVLYLFGKKREKREKSEPSHLSLLFVFLATLFLTFSRGAIYSFGVGFALLLVLNFFPLKNPSFLKALPVLLFSFLFTLISQGVFAATSPTTDTFLSGIEKSISQLSLGKIELDLDKAPRPSRELEPMELESEAHEEETEVETALFSGYVEESTNVRLVLNRSALEVATSSPKNLIFGTGLGSAGKVLFREGKTESEKEIVQNEYLSLLLETGLFGLLLLVVGLIILFLDLEKSFALPERFLLFAMILSFLLSLGFFSGLPNALHLFLFPVFVAFLLPKHEPVIN
ncbi:O-antigen ligase family protein [Candidatus Saccharibacteria bacterium]|nr:O-antigen ligase family protein [Candidatus Saccharibacteria bacterium]